MAIPTLEEFKEKRRKQILDTARSDYNTLIASANQQDDQGIKDQLIAQAHANIRPVNEPDYLESVLKSQLDASPEYQNLTRIHSSNLLDDPIIQALWNKSQAQGPGGVASQQLDERLTIQSEGQIETQKREASRTALLSRIPGLTTELGGALLTEQNRALESARPMIETSLARQGLLQSGALPEALAKYLANLEAARQSKLQTYATGLHQLADVDLPLQETQGNIDLLRGGLQRQFSVSDIAQQRGIEEDMFNRELQAAEALSERQRRAARSRALAGLIGLGIGAVAGGASTRSLQGAQVGGAFGEQFGELFGEL